MYEYLINNGAKLDIKNNQGKTPIDFLKRYSGIKLFIEKGFDAKLFPEAILQKTFIKAVWEGNRELIKHLVNNEIIRVSVIPKKQIFQFLKSFCSQDNIELFKLLVDKGVDSSHSFLHFACKNSILKIVKFLLLDGANINVVNKYGKTPLYQSP